MKTKMIEVNNSNNKLIEQIDNGIVLSKNFMTRINLIDSGFLLSCSVAVTQGPLVSLSLVRAQTRQHIEE